MAKREAITWLEEASRGLDHPAQVDLYKMYLSTLLDQYEELSDPIKSKIKVMLSKKDYDGYVTDFAKIAFVALISNIKRGLIEVCFPFAYQDKDVLFNEFLIRLMQPYQLLKIFETLYL